MGVLNARLEIANDVFERVMSNQGLWVMNENGEMFAELYNNYSLMISCTVLSQYVSRKIFIGVTPTFGPSYNNIVNACAASFM